MRRSCPNGGAQHNLDSHNEGSGGSPLVAVAINSSKNSQHALKWAADHVIPKGQIFFLLHVRRKPTLSSASGQEVADTDVDEEVLSALYQQMNAQTKGMLLPFQCFCNRRGLQFKEVILEDTDIPKAIVDFVMHQSIGKLVLGASSRNAFMRTFKSADVPTFVLKVMPESCSVYVISKGKISSFRPASRPNKYPSKTTHNFETTGIEFQSIKSEPDVMHYREVPGRYASENSGLNEAGFAGGYFDYSYQSVISCPSPSRTSGDQFQNYYLQDYLDGGGNVTSLSPSRSSADQLSNYNLKDQVVFRGSQSRLSNMRNADGPNSYSTEPMESYESKISGVSYLSNGLGYSTNSCSPSALQKSGTGHSSNQLMDGMQSEMRRLQLGSKQSMNTDNTAWKEALNAKQQTRSWIVDEVSRIEASLAEGTAAEKQKLPGVEANKSKMDGYSWKTPFRKYTIEEILEATDNFSNDLKIGEGGYGPVFKATLDHTLVAIKILGSDKTQGMKQFQQEIDVLSRIRHPNMVLLVGACLEFGCLVYEYMAHGSLDDCLFSRSNTAPLSWQLRFKIAAEIATGLQFLHQSKPEPLVHRDLKPGNILLDHNFISKIADVGLARLVPPSVANAVTQYHMTAAAGTFCYIDPEYQQTGMLGIKSDIYALGIILLQLITGAPPMGLAHNVENAIEMGKLEETLDPNVSDWPMEETMKIAKLALKCAELRKKDRPDLGSVVLPELNRMRAFAEEKQPVSRLFYRGDAGYYKESMSAPCIGGSGFPDRGIVESSSSSSTVGQTGGSSFS